MPEKDAESFNTESWSRVFQSDKKGVGNTKVDKSEIPVDSSKFNRAALKVLQNACFNVCSECI